MDGGERSIVSELDARTRAFELRFMRTASAGLATVMVAALSAISYFQPSLVSVACLGIIVIATGSAFGLTFTPYRRSAAAVLLFGTSCGALLAVAFDGTGTLGSGALQALLINVALSPFLLPRSGVIALVGFNAGAGMLAHLKVGLVDGGSPADLVPAAVGSALVLGVAALSISSFVGQAKEHQDSLRQRLHDIDIVMERARRIAKGDLAGEIQGDSDVSRVIASMLGGLRGLVEQIQKDASQLTHASNEIAAMAQQQERSAIEQGGAIEETRRTVGTLLQGSRSIAGAARGVTDNASATLQNAELISDRIRTLTEHAQRITELLELIRDVANKSELLALNAALEGAKAGEAGRGFSLVANQMQRLAESVMESVKIVKELTGDIRKATQATALATEDATKLARDTTDAARRIGVITEEQESSTEQVTRAMDEIADATHQSAAGTNQTLQAVRELSQIAERLHHYTSQFQL
ncbi:methyl-accepting chemotaxis protein [Sandaracinus amylolyticus]|uniref:methyl-accepting chemotaxis protein n=1 Tax=Sandaracinus amylolyticus TaxID=927083 RepID=UPI001F00B494|nr:methyl-accepting chemotaxis protein [Sandaracinus amylolyticus]UJR80106.1 Methyl-accepting chemotaxis protein [Sandaracinus amylolyticus]